MGTIKENVRQLMMIHPKTRDCDKTLCARYWYEVDKIKFPMTGADFVNYATNPTSITRARALIQESGELLPSEDVKRRRREKEEAFRTSIRGEKNLPRGNYHV